nr:MAG TPA: hypothetical protein [Caudoviricetes sp.]
MILKNVFFIAFAVFCCKDEHFFYHLQPSLYMMPFYRCMIHR